jgi:hypothetical protein
MSGLTNLNSRWYNGTEYQNFAFEYSPGAVGNVTWFVGEDKTWTLDGRAIGPNGNIGQRMIPLEPMSVVFNLGMADNFAPQNHSIKHYMPAYLRVDYIRIYQDPDEESITCDPPGYETTKYIREHEKAYKDANLTNWYVFHLPILIHLSRETLLILFIGRLLGTTGPRTATCTNVQVRVCFVPASF